VEFEPVLQPLRRDSGGGRGWGKSRSEELRFTLARERSVVPDSAGGCLSAGPVPNCLAAVWDNQVRVELKGRYLQVNPHLLPDR